MPTGHPIPMAIRQLLVYHFCVVGTSVDHVHDNLFLPQTIAKYTLERLRDKLLAMDPADRGKYIEGHGDCREGLLEEGSENEHFLKEILSSHRTYSMYQLTKRFHKDFYPAYADNLPSLSTIYRAVCKFSTRKKVDYINVHKDPVQQIAFLGDIAHVASNRLVDIDGMVQTDDDFYKRYGWAPRGEECRQAQLYIGRDSYAVHAAFTELGFLPGGWKIFPGTVTEIQVREFVESIRDSLPLFAYGLFDNASNQRTDDVRRAIEDVFDGFFMYCSPYSPELKPIERGFSLVKRYIRDKEAEWGEDHIGLINAAFHHYSVGQPGGLKAYNLFKVYRENYEAANEVLKKK
jgi:hypothetical protein